MKKNIMGRLAIAMIGAISGGANLPHILPRNGYPTAKPRSQSGYFKGADAQRLAAAEAKRERRAKRNMENAND